MIIKDKTNIDIERHKQRLGLKGDVYIINDRFIESLESHKNLIPNSVAKNIEEAEIERLIYEVELEAKRKQLEKENLDE